MNTRRLGLFTAPAILGVFLVSAPAFAQFDHLKCYKIKDNQRVFVASAHTVDLVPEHSPPFDPEDCTVKMKAKFFCTDVRKENVLPLPPGAPAGPDTTQYVCYKFKGRCSPAVPVGLTVDVTDQFASGSIEIKKAGMLCAPADLDLGTTTSTTSTTSSTTTTPVSSTTTSTGQACYASTAPACGGQCPPGNSCRDIGGFCFCFDDNALPCYDSHPMCDGGCPVDNVCVGGIGGTACFCVPSEWQQCSESAPACDDTCPLGFTCTGGALVCECTPE